jgi:hypothetical protein
LDAFVIYNQPLALTFMGSMERFLGGYSIHIAHRFKDALFALPTTL